MDQATTSRYPIWPLRQQAEPEITSAELPTTAISAKRKFLVFSPKITGSVNRLHQVLVNHISQAFNETGPEMMIKESFSIWSLKQLAHSIRQADAVYLPIFTSPRITFGLIAHAVIGRFFHKPVIIHLANQEYGKGESPNPAILYVLEQLADALFVPSTVTAQNGKRRSVDFLAPVVNHTDTNTSQSALQPRIATILDEESALVLPVIIKAFTVVKQKYPRAELVLLCDPNKKEIREELAEFHGSAGISQIDLAEWQSFRNGPVNADVVLDFSSFSIDRTALLTALAEGLPVISFEQPGTKSLIADGVEGIVISRLDRSFIAGRIIRLIESPETVASFSREAVRLARRFSPSQVIRQLQDILAAHS